MSSPHDKTGLRHVLRAQRRDYAAEHGRNAAAALADQAMDVLTRLTGGSPVVIAAYHALQDEIDPAPLLSILRTAGHHLALPVTADQKARMSFVSYDAGTVFRRSSFGVLEPEGGDVVRPDIVLVPLLGFDAACHRLGYGAGHYDRTLAALRADGQRLFAAGLAFDMQKVEAIPHDAHDQALDCVITDASVYWPDKE